MENIIFSIIAVVLLLILGALFFPIAKRNTRNANDDSFLPYIDSGSSSNVSTHNPSDSFDCGFEGSGDFGGDCGGGDGGGGGD